MAPFHAALLAGGFVFGRVIAGTNLRFGFGVALVFALTLAVWGLAMQFGQAQARAHALFVTPATFAAVINLLLAPALIIGLYGLGSWRLLAAVSVLSAAFIGAQSRGGWIALMLALGVTALLARHVGLRLQPRSALRTLLAALLGVAAWWISAELLFGEDRSHAFLDQAAPSFRERLSLYALAWRGVEQSSWMLGSGYQAFYYLLEIASARPEYAYRSTYFVHNDYLQAVLELGLPGLLGLAFITLAPLLTALRRRQSELVETDNIALVATLAAISTIALHAMVDFPFYIPVCALVFGGLLGTADVLLVRGGRMPAWTFASLVANASVRRAMVAAAVTLMAWVLTVPALAEAAANRAFAYWRQGQGQEAAFWFEAARRLCPRDWRFHWYAGQFWLAQAEESRRPDLAERADKAYAAAFAANPREGHSLLGRLVTQMRLRDVLPKPADAATLLAWSEEVVRLSPRTASALAERERVRNQFASQR